MSCSRETRPAHHGSLGCDSHKSPYQPFASLFMKTSSPRIGVFVSYSGNGGVERMVSNLVRGIIELGIDVDMLLVKARGDYVKEIPSQANVRVLRAGHTLTSLLELTDYLRRDTPLALLAVKERAIKIASIARRLAGAGQCRLVGRLGTHLSEAMRRQNRRRLQVQWRYQSIRWLFRGVDDLIAVSQGVAEDFIRIAGFDDNRMHVVRNPVITPELYRRAAVDPADAWLDHANTPLITGVGRLTLQKDFPALIRAFAIVRARQACRLVILGEGSARKNLQQLARQLGVDNDVHMPGFKDNPYAYLARSRLFVLSSQWEGSPNALTEAMALGIPVVATDCPSGPRELLNDGCYGPLVPVGNVQALAQAMAQTLSKPLEPEPLRQAVAEYAMQNSAKAYLHVLGVRS